MLSICHSQPDKSGVSLSSKSTTASREVDASEYNPVVVELPSATDSDHNQENGIHDENEECSDERQDCGRGTVGNERWSEEKRTGLWVAHLEKRRKKFLAAMSNEDRLKFLNSLEI